MRFVIVFIVEVFLLVVISCRLIAECISLLHMVKKGKRKGEVLNEGPITLSQDTCIMVMRVRCCLYLLV